MNNTMKPRTYPAIYFGPTGNIQGTNKAFDLNTGKVTKPRTFTLYPMPDARPRNRSGNRIGKRGVERDSKS